MDKIVIDCIKLSDDKEEVYQYLTDAFSFDSNWGHNLDAFYDLLTSITEPKIICLFDSYELELSTLGKRVVNVINEAARNNESLMLMKIVKGRVIR